MSAPDEEVSAPDEEDGRLLDMCSRDVTVTATGSGEEFNGWCQARVWTTAIYDDYTFCMTYIYLTMRRAFAVSAIPNPVNQVVAGHAPCQPFPIRTTLLKCIV